MVQIQLDMFKTAEECELDALRKCIEETKHSADKVRRGTYARLNELGKECIDLKARLELIERNICKGLVHV